MKTNTTKLKRKILHETILPIFKTKKAEPYELISFQGMGFIAAPRVLITCWHCVSGTLEKDEQCQAPQNRSTF